jgi:hypothetical protein
MSVALLLNMSHDVDQLLGWASLLARARKEDLLMLQSVRAVGEAKVVMREPDPDASDSSLVAAIEKNVGDNFDWRQPEGNGDDGDAKVPNAKPKLQVCAKDLHHHAAAYLAWRPSRPSVDLFC